MLRRIWGAGNGVRVAGDRWEGCLLGAVITDRSAVTGLVDGVLYLARDGRARDVELPACG